MMRLNENLYFLNNPTPLASDFDATREGGEAKSL